MPNRTWKQETATRSNDALSNDALFREIDIFETQIELRRRGKIDENSCASEQGENDEADAKSRRVELEVAAKSAADAREHLVRRAPLEPPYRIGMCDVFGHAPSLPRPRTQDHPDFPWSHPDPQERGITPARLANCGGCRAATTTSLSKIVAPWP